MADAAWLTSGRLRARRDLQMTDSDEATVVKDPLSLEYFRIGDRERFLIETLAEPLTINELTKRYRRRFPNERSTGSQVLAFCASLYDCALLTSDQPLTPVQGRLRGRQDTPWYAVLATPLAIRFPGFDPTSLLGCLSGLGTVFFSRAFAMLLLVTVVLVAIGLVGQAERLSTELVHLVDLVDPAYGAMAIVAVLLTKTWHELGHAIACRRMGAECHEMGMMLLAFFPCLYCDVSDAWTLPNRWQRAAVALAGVYFEAILAILAAAAWLFLAPGPLAVLSLYVVVTASVSTLAVNLNPLIRFDGYYVLADTWGVTNLHEQSRSALWGPLRRWVRGERGTGEPLDAPPVLLAVYGLASTIYGWCLLAVILWFTYKSVDAVGFSAVGDLLVAVTLGGVALVGAKGAAGMVPRGPNGRSLGAMARFAGIVAIAGCAIAWVASLPIEQSLHARCRLESSAFAEVVASSEGRLDARASYGDWVNAGEVLAVLVDPDDELRRFELLEREAALHAEREGLRTRAPFDAALLAEIARLEPTLAEVRRQLRSHEAQVSDRQLRAPISGRIVPPSLRADASGLESIDGDLAAWSGAPLDEANRGCTLQEGESLCRIVEGNLQAVLLLSEDDSGLVRIGDPVRIALDRSPGAYHAGQVMAISLAAADADVAREEERIEAVLRGPLERAAAYRITVSLRDAAVPEAQQGALGQARIVTGRETVYGRAARLFRRLFRLT